MNNPKVIIELETVLNADEKILVEKFLNYVDDVGNVEIHDGDTYESSSTFADVLYEKMKKIEHDDMVGDYRD